MRCLRKSPAAADMLTARRVVDGIEMRRRAEPRVAHTRLVAPPPRVRADIVDRNGTLLATNLDSPSVYVNSKRMLQAGEDPERAAQAITTALPDLSPTELRAKLSSGRNFAYLKRS